MLLPRSCLKVDLRAQNHLVFSGGDLAHFNSRTVSHPSSQALASSVPSLATTLPSASRKLRYPIGSFSFELSSRSLRGRVVALAPESTTKSTRVHPVHWSVASFEPVSVLPPKAETLPTGGLPFAFSAFSAFLLFSLFRSLRCFFAFLHGRRNLCLGRGQLSRSSLWLGQLLQQRAAGVPGERRSCLLVFQLLFGQGKDLLLLSSPRLVKAACPAECAGSSPSFRAVCSDGASRSLGPGGLPSPACPPTFVPRRVAVCSSLRLLMTAPSS